MYGSGFPKSLDVSKAIDKAAPRAGMFDEFARHFEEQRNKKGFTQKAIAQHFPSKTGGLTGCVWNWENGANVPTPDQWAILQPMLDLSKEWLPLIERMEAEREVIEISKNGIAGGTGKHAGQEKAYGFSGEFDITAPSTPEAKQWEGWGTALKPAFEPIVVARKPLIGTVAENVLTHGTGGLNIDGSRIGTTGGKGIVVGVTEEKQDKNGGWRTKNVIEDDTIRGRWPANVILDEYTAELLDEQSGQSKSPAIGSVTKTKPRHSGSMSGAFNHFEDGMSNGYGDTGGASRFFYVAKASKRDRNEGLEDLEAKLKPYGNRSPEDVPEEGDPKGSVNDKFTTQPAKNFHPTVKPTDLMRYLIKLVTPPGGVVLDPFTGSGSTGKAAILEGFRFIGCELTEDYIPIIEGRLQHAETMAAEAEAKKDEALF
jgi:hypothetical protein